MKSRRGFTLLFCAQSLIEGVLWAILIGVDRSLPLWFYLALMGMLVGHRWLMNERRSGMSTHHKILLGAVVGGVPVFPLLFCKFDWLGALIAGVYLACLAAEWRWQTFSRRQERRDKEKQ